jgi:DNA polymerase I-like protein with 3'-5' exonuclease and polymerase domains
VEGCLAFAWPDGTVHPEWNSAAALTGRFSATTMDKGMTYKRGPALQTIPTPDTLESKGWMYNPREWFIAAPGKCFGIMDLSQAEVRMLAVMSQDPELMRAVNGGTDVHSGIASRAYKKEWDAAVNDPAARKKIRSHSKEVTFGGPTSYAEVKSAQLLETLNGNQQPEGMGTFSNGSETHSMARQVMVWDAQA